MYSFGGSVYNETLATKVEGANPKYNADERVLNDRWKTPGTVAKYKRIDDTTTPYQTSRFVEKNNFLRMSSFVTLLHSRFQQTLFRSTD